MSKVSCLRKEHSNEETNVASNNRPTAIESGGGQRINHYIIVHAQPITRETEMWLGWDYEQYKEMSTISIFVK